MGTKIPSRPCAKSRLHFVHALGRRLPSSTLVANAPASKTSTLESVHDTPYLSYMFCLCFLQLEKPTLLTMHKDDVLVHYPMRWLSSILRFSPFPNNIVLPFSRSCHLDSRPAFSRCRLALPFVLARRKLGTVGPFLVQFHLMTARGTVPKRRGKTTSAGVLSDCYLCIYL